MFEDKESGYLTSSSPFGTLNTSKIISTWSSRMGCRMLLRYVKGSFQLQIALEAQMKSIALGRHAAMQAALKGLSRWAMDWSAQMRQFPLLETQLQWFKSRWHKPQDDLKPTVKSKLPSHVEMARFMMDHSQRKSDSFISSKKRSIV